MNHESFSATLRCVSNSHWLHHVLWPHAHTLQKINEVRLTRRKLKILMGSWNFNVSGTLATLVPSQYKDSLSRYGDCHYKDKMVVITILVRWYLYTDIGPLWQCLSTIFSQICRAHLLSLTGDSLASNLCVSHLENVNIPERKIHGHLYVK